MMSSEADLEYSLHREAQERSAAEAAVDASIRDIHLNLADRYADRAWSQEEALHEAGLNG